jgi:hypothetical protein
MKRAWFGMVAEALGGAPCQNLVGPWCAECYRWSHCAIAGLDDTTRGGADEMQLEPIGQGHELSE